MVSSSVVSRWAHYGTLAVALVLMISALMPGVDWASFHRTGRAARIDYNLEAELGSYDFEYTLTATLGSGNFSIGPVKRTYAEVRGDVLENLGIIYGSYKVKSYIYELVMEPPPQGSGVTWPGPGSPSAYLNVTLSSELIPYWPEVGTKELTVTVELLGSDLHGLVGPSEMERFAVELREVSIMALTDYDGSTGELSGDPVKVKGSTKGHTFREVGDRTVMTFDVHYPEGAEVAGMYVEIEAGLTDFWGRPERAPLSGGANTIDIRPIPTWAGILILGIPLALPLIILSSVLLLLSAVRNRKRRTPVVGLSLAGLLLLGLALLWFRSGTLAAVDLLSQRLEGAREGLEFSTGMVVASSGFAFQLASFSALIVWRTMSGKDGSKAHPEEKEMAGKRSTKSPHPGEGQGPGSAASEILSTRKFTVVNDRSDER